MEQIDREIASVEGINSQGKRILKARAIMRRRELARTEKNFTLSDELRQKLIELGVDVLDQKNGPSGWKFKDGSSKKLPAGLKLPASLTAPDNNGTASSISSNPQHTSKKRSSSEAPEETSAKKVKTSKALPTTASTVTQQTKKEQDRAKNALNTVLGTTSKVRNVEGVLIEDVLVGSGRKSASGDRLKMHYVGRLKSNNKIFDSSNKKPFVFRLGRGEVIRGWDIGCSDMCVGGKRILTIPPAKGYGNAGAPPTIPGNATLVFEISLLEIL